MKSEAAMNTAAEELSQDFALQLQQLLQQQSHFTGDKLAAEGYHTAEPQFNLSHLEAYLSNEFSEDSDKENLKASGSYAKSSEIDSKNLINDEFYNDSKSQVDISVDSQNIHSKAENLLMLSNVEQSSSVKSHIEGVYYECNNNHLSSIANNEALPPIESVNVDNKLRFRVSNSSSGVVYSRRHSNNEGDIESEQYENSNFISGIDGDNKSSFTISSSGSNIISVSKSNDSGSKTGSTTVYTLGSISSMMGKSLILGGGVKCPVGPPKSTPKAESPKSTDIPDENSDENLEVDDFVGPIKSPSSGSDGGTKRTMKSCKSKPDKLPKTGGSSKSEGAGHTSAVGGARRNERERNRVKQVNLGFDRLRQHVPQGRRNKKLSKVDTLRAAVDYIAQLRQLLQLDDIVALSQESYNQHGLDECMTNSDQMINWCEDLQQQQHELHQQHLHQQYQDQQFQQNEELIKNQSEFFVGNIQTGDGLLSPQKRSPLFVDNLISSPGVQSCSNIQPGLELTQHPSTETLAILQQQQQQDQILLQQYNTNPHMLVSQPQRLPQLVSNLPPSTSSHQAPQHRQISLNSQILTKQLQEQNKHQNISLTELLSHCEPYAISSKAYTVDNSAISPTSMSSRVSSIGYGSLAGDVVATYSLGFPVKAEQSIGSPIQTLGMPVMIAQSLDTPISPSDGLLVENTTLTNSNNSVSMASLMCLMSGGNIESSDFGHERISTWIN